MPGHKYKKDNSEEHVINKTSIYDSGAVVFSVGSVCVGRKCELDAASPDVLQQPSYLLTDYRALPIGD